MARHAWFGLQKFGIFVCISSKVDNMKSSASTVHVSIESRFFYVLYKVYEQQQCIKSIFECISPAAQSVMVECQDVTRMIDAPENPLSSAITKLHYKYTISSYSPAFSFSKNFPICFWKTAIYITLNWENQACSPSPYYFNRIDVGMKSLRHLQQLGCYISQVLSGQLCNTPSICTRNCWEKKIWFSQTLHKISEKMFGQVYSMTIFFRE